LILKLKCQSLFQRDALLLKVKYKIWVIYRKFSGKLPVIYGNGNIPNLIGNFRTLDVTGPKMAEAVKRES